MGQGSSGKQGEGEGGTNEHGVGLSMGLIGASAARDRVAKRILSERPPGDKGAARAQVTRKTSGYPVVDPGVNFVTGEDDEALARRASSAGRRRQTGASSPASSLRMRTGARFLGASAAAAGAVTSAAAAAGAAMGSSSLMTRV
mmetsp:Transcript_34339/g.62657  ORF Transcript_34339/g.62657 Transcript_34339/m.62657 type:complete len:144 (+) Transcript_34339:489-920(+)